MHVYRSKRLPRLCQKNQSAQGFRNGGRWQDMPSGREGAFPFVAM